jgi:hypothetical protein
MNNVAPARLKKVEFVAELSKLKPSSTFLSLHHYTNSYGEIADFNIVFHMSYMNALKKSINALKSIHPEHLLQRQAKDELIMSWQTSINKIETTDIEDIDDTYIRFFDESGAYIKGIKLHEPSQCLHIYGLVHKKRIIQPGSYPTVNRQPLTIEKDKLRSIVPVGKFRQFKIVPEQVERISVNKLNLFAPV